MSDRSVTSFVAVFIGGIVGTLARFGVDLALPHETISSLSISTVIVNVVGSFALGVLVGGVWIRPGVPTWVKVGIGPGLLGSFTTLSAISLTVVAGANDGRWVDALLAIALSLALGLTSAWFGLKLGRRMGSAAGAS